MIASRIWRALCAELDSASTFRMRHVVAEAAHVRRGGAGCLQPFLEALVADARHHRGDQTAPRRAEIDRPVRCRPARCRCGSGLPRSCGGREPRSGAPPARRSRSRESARACPAPRPARRARAPAAACRQNRESAASARMPPARGWLRGQPRDAAASGRAATAHRRGAIRCPSQVLASRPPVARFRDSSANRTRGAGRPTTRCAGPASARPQERRWRPTAARRPMRTAG